MTNRNIIIILYGLVIRNGHKEWTRKGMDRRNGQIGSDKAIHINMSEQTINNLTIYDNSDTSCAHL